MGLSGRLKRLNRLPGILKARHLAEVTVTPHLRGELAELRAHIERRDFALAQLNESIVDIQRHLPAVLSAISSVNGMARRMQRELEPLRGTREALEVAYGRLDGLDRWVEEHHDDSTKLIALWREDLSPHVASIGWLLERVEVVRAEVMNELRYATPHGGGERAHVEPRVIDPSTLEGPDVRLNLGAGHVALDGYANVDMRELPGIDVVAELDDLPVEPGSVAEIFSAHVLEHFPREQLRRTLLPYWASLLRPGGRFRAVVPDLRAMAAGYAAGTIPFDAFREVVYGGQEYEGDTHFNGFTADDLAALLRAAGLVDIEVVAESRPNGACLELEISATRPAT